MAEALQELELPSGHRTAPLPARGGTQEVPFNYPLSRSQRWFSSGSSIALPNPIPGTLEWKGERRRTHETHGLSLGPAIFQKFHFKGYGIQTYKGAQNPSSTKIMCAAAMQMAEDPVTS